MSEDFEFAHTAALLDTNIWKEMTLKTKRAESFRPLFEFLRENNMVPFLTDATKFELLGFSTSKKSFDFFDGFISVFWTHALTRDDIELATKIACMYKVRSPEISPKQISFVDCLHAAYMRRFKRRAVLITADINDYPSFLFDLVRCMPIDEGNGTTSFVGFKATNEEKWAELEASFNKSGS